LRGLRRVLLTLGWYDYRLHRGIERYAQAHGWDLSQDLVREKVIPWGWEGDGILAWLGAGDDLASFVLQAGKPTVDFSYRRPQLPFAHVLEDHAAAGRLVAEHFLARGFRSLVYYSDAPNWVYEERGQGFVDMLAQAGRKCTWLRWHRSPARRTGRDAWRRKREWLAEKMERANKPVAVFAAADGHAMDLLEACNSAGLKVPDEVAIVGAGDTLLAPDAMRIPISSVDTGIETLGFMGAELLDRLMGGAAVPKEPVRLPPVALMARKSSDAMAVPHDKVARCLRFIWDNCQKPIGVDDLVKVAAMSRRGLHQAFVEHVGRPPGAELQRVRIERSKRLLAASDDKLETVAGLCGYRRVNSFWLAFKHATGVSPQQYRQRVRR
jgi:LacI family transcriptional regulator